MIRVANKLLNNKVLLFIGSRYLTYLLQFINSLFIAVYLGPYYLGIWGFITLIIQYLNQINFGIAHSVNATISIFKDKTLYVDKVIGVSMTMLIFLSVLVILFFTTTQYIINFNFGEKYNFSVYMPLVVLIGILGYFNTLFSNIFRVYGKLIEIAFNQTIFPVLMILAILFFKGESLVWALVVANLLAFLLSFALFIKNSPVRIKPILITRLLKSIQIKGWHLFIYATSFYLIIISTRSFVSAYFSVSEFGYFTFAFTLANVVQLLLESFSFLIFPKLLNRLATVTKERVVELLRFVRDVYITSSHLVVHIAILLYPIFLLLFPKYAQTDNAFKLIALTIVLYTNSFGYSGLLIAKGYEKKLGKLSLLALVFNIICVFILIKVFNSAYDTVIVGTMVTYLLYTYFLTSLGRKKLELNSSVWAILKDSFSIRLFAPFFLSFVLIQFSCVNVFFIGPLLLFIILNIKSIGEIFQIAKNAAQNPDIINI